MLSRLTWRALSAAPLALALSCPAAAEDVFAPDHLAAMPAVSAVNGKLGIFGGSLSDEGVAGLSGALALPVGHSLGLQLDGMAGSIDDDPFYGIGAHLFWRDPSRGLIGLYASFVSWDASGTVESDELEGGFAEVTGADVGKVGLEAEAYLGRVSLEGLAAYQFGTEHGFAGKATFAYYPADDLRFDISIKHLEGQGVSGSAGAEWALPSHDGFSLFADASVDEESDWRALAGAKFHFGSPGKNLIQRHREDDPDIELPGDLQASEGKSRCPRGQVGGNGPGGNGGKGQQDTPPPSNSCLGPI
jgi:hypothetical protein